jgi:2'-5' RNA ligase
MPRLFIGSFLVGPEAERISSITRARADQFSSGFKSRLSLDQSSNSGSDALPHQDKELRIRALPQEKLHMTWLFLGEVSSEQVDEITGIFVVTLEQLKNKLSCTAFEISYDQLSLWPSEDKARVAVLRPSAPPPEVAIIDSEIRAALSNFQENEEVYPQFNPHLTVFRISPAGDLRAIKLMQMPPMTATTSLPSTSSNSSIPEVLPGRESMPYEQPILPVKHTISIDDIHLIESENGYTIIA